MNVKQLPIYPTIIHGPPPPGAIPLSPIINRIIMDPGIGNIVNSNSNQYTVNSPTRMAKQPSVNQTYQNSAPNSARNNAPKANINPNGPLLSGRSSVHVSPRVTVPQIPIPKSSTTSNINIPNSPTYSNPTTSLQNRQGSYQNIQPNIVQNNQTYTQQSNQNTITQNNKNIYDDIDVVCESWVIHEKKKNENGVEEVWEHKVENNDLFAIFNFVDTDNDGFLRWNSKEILNLITQIFTHHNLELPIISQTIWYGLFREADRDGDFALNFKEAAHFTLLIYHKILNFFPEVPWS